MTHKGCNGRVLVDRVFSNYQHAELSCLRCGNRWELVDPENAFTRWIIKSEYSFGVNSNGKS
jgi:hypothetical protein